jgi:putative SOS response-associated peptidase YedK
VCGRYVTVSSPALLAERFDVTDIRIPDQELEPSYNVAPRADVPVVAERKGEPGTHERVLDVVRWGLVPFWAKDPKIGDRMINARAETLLTSNAFKRPFERRRCIIPADGFYEWEKLEPEKTRSGSPAPKGRSGARKQPWFIRRKDGEPLAFAGLWETWRDRSQGDDALPLRTCVIITGEPNELLAPIHNRMPVVLPESVWSTWLDVDNHDVEALQQLLVPSPADELEKWAVSTLVNKADNNGPELLTPVEGASA